MSDRIFDHLYNCLLKFIYQYHIRKLNKSQLIMEVICGLCLKYQEGLLEEKSVFKKSELENVSVAWIITVLLKG